MKWNIFLIAAVAPQGAWASRPHQRVGKGVRTASASQGRDTRDLSALSIKNRHCISDTTANYSNIQDPKSNIPNLLPVCKIASPVLRLGKCVGLLAVLVLASGNLNAQTNTQRIWTGGSNGALTTASNWNPNGAPSVSVDAIFNSTTNNASLTATSATFGSISVNGTSTFTFLNRTTGATNSNLTLGGAGNNGNSFSGTSSDVLYVTSGSSFTIQGPNASSGSGVINVILGQNGTFNIAGTAAISSTISGTNLGFTKTGAGTLTLNGSNTYTGSTTINAGNLTISGGNAITDNGTVILANTAGVNFNVNASETIGTLQGGGVTGGTVNIAASQTLTVNQTSDQTFAGVITGATGGLTKTGANTLTLSGSNTYGGLTTINAGNLTISGGSAIANTGTVTLANTAGVGFNVNSSETIASLQGGGSTGGIVTIAASQTLTVAETGSQSFAGALQGSGSLTKSGAGTLTLSGSNTNSGAVSVTTGTLALSGANALSSGISSLNATSSTISLTDGTGRTYTISDGGLNLSDATMRFDIGATSDRLTFTNGSATLSGTNTIYLTDIGSFSYSSPITLISAASGLNGATWSLNSTAAPTGYSYSLSSTATDLTLVAVQNSAFYYWKGANGSTWGTANNWTSDSAGNTLVAGAPTSNADVVFAATGASNLSNTLGADYTINTLSVSTAGVTIAGANTVTASATSSSAYNISATSGTTAISANLAGSAAGLTKSGAGTLTLSGANTFAGGVTLSAGTLNLNSATAPGNGTITITGGTLDNTSGSSVTLSNNNAQNWNGNFAFTGTKDLNMGTGAVALGASRTVTVNGGNLTIGGVISGSGFSLTKAGAGTLILGGANSYTGGTTLSAGNLAINNSGSGGTTSAIGTGTLTISGGTLDNTSGSSVTLSTNNAQNWNGDFAFTGTNDLNLGNGAVTMNANRIVTVNGGNLTVGGAISGTSASFTLTKAGTGTLILGGVNTYTGATTVSGGTLQTSAADRMSDSSAISVSSGATFALGGNETVASIAGAGNYSLGASTLTFGDTSNQTVSGTISGTGGLVKSGSGSIALSGSNSYSGGTTISSGTIRIGHDNALGSGNITSTTGSVAFASSDATARTISNSYTSIAGSSVVVTFGEASGGTGDLTFAGTGSTSISTGTRTFNVLNTTSLAGGIVGSGASGSIIKTGTGTLILYGSNTYQGATTINAGTLQLGNGGTTGALSASSAITVNATLAFNRSNTVTQGTDFSSTLGGSGVVVQNGSGNLILNQANTYTGGTTLNSGTLTLNHASAAGTGTLTQSSGASLLHLNAAGTFANAMSVYNVKASETLTLSGGITVNNATFEVDNGDTLTISNTVNGTGGVSKTGGGKLVLSGSNTYEGATTVNSGTLEAAHSNALGSNNTVNINGGSLLVTANDAINGKNITLNSTSTVGLAFSGNYHGSIGRLTLEADSIIDFGNNSVVANFAEIAGLNNYVLKIYNWTGATLWNGGIGNNTDQIYFGSGASGNLDRITFYSDFGNSFLGTGYQISGGSYANEVIPVPEPQTWATAVVLLSGAVLYFWSRNKRRGHAV